MNSVVIRNKPTVTVEKPATETVAFTVTIKEKFNIKNELWNCLI
jgi:hypothetical protein